MSNLWLFVVGIPFIIAIIIFLRNSFEKYGSGFGGFIVTILRVILGIIGLISLIFFIFIIGDQYNFIKNTFIKYIDLFIITLCILLGIFIICEILKYIIEKSINKKMVIVIKEIIVRSLIIFVINVIISFELTYTIQKIIEKSYLLIASVLVMVILTIINVYINIYLTLSLLNDKKISSKHNRA